MRGGATARKFTKFAVLRAPSRARAYARGSRLTSADEWTGRGDSGTTKGIVQMPSCRTEFSREELKGLDASVFFRPKADIQDLPTVALLIGRHVTFSRYLIHGPLIVELAIGQMPSDQLVNK